MASHIRTAGSPVADGRDPGVSPLSDEGWGISRREALAFAAAVPAVAMSVPARAAIAGGTGPLRAVVDSRITQAASFAGRLSARGGQVFAFAGDMAALWFDELLPSLQADRGPLIGLTGTGALFCFEQLGWQAGMRLRLHIGHSRTADGFAHAVAGFPAARLDPPAARDADFGAAAADFVLDSRPLWRDRTHASAVASGLLATWVIAPTGIV